MNVRVLAVPVLSLLALSGCVATSLHPLYTERDVVAEPRLFGRWQGLPPPPGSGSLFDETFWEPGGTWVVERGRHDTFRATQQEGDETNVYAGRVVRLGEQLFLDLEPDSAEFSKCRGAFPSVACHAFFSLRFTGDTLVVGYLRSDWLQDAARHGRLGRAAGLAITEEDEVLLTGSTAEVRRILLRAAREAEAFSIGKLVRLE